MGAEAALESDTSRSDRREVQNLDFSIEGERLRDDDKTPTQENILSCVAEKGGVGGVDGVRRGKERGNSF